MCGTGDIQFGTDDPTDCSGGSQIQSAGVGDTAINGDRTAGCQVQCATTDGAGGQHDSVRFLNRHCLTGIADGQRETVGIGDQWLCEAGGTDDNLFGDNWSRDGDCSWSHQRHRTTSGVERGIDGNRSTDVKLHGLTTDRRRVDRQIAGNCHVDVVVIINSGQRVIACDGCWQLIVWNVILQHTGGVRNENDFQFGGGSGVQFRLNESGFRHRLVVVEGHLPCHYVHDVCTGLLGRVIRHAIVNAVGGLFDRPGRSQHDAAGSTHSA